VRKQFELANARLMVGRPYQPDYAGDQARTMLAQMMIKRKLKAKDIDGHHEGTAGPQTRGHLDRGEVESDRGDDL
jgi:hypothetical protein